MFCIPVAFTIRKTDKEEHVMTIRKHLSLKAKQNLKPLLFPIRKPQHE